MPDPPPAVVAAGCIIFIISWIFLAIRKIPQLPIGRGAGTVLGATLMVVTGVISPMDAYSAVDGNTIALLFGTMLITVYLDRDGYFEKISRLLSANMSSARAFLVRITVTTGFLAALLTNDTVCVFLTPVVVIVCTQKKLAFGPLLMSVATSANIGSSATVVGNPQNIIIGSFSGISFQRFSGVCLPAAIVGFLVNVGLLFLYYQKHLASDGSSTLPSGGSEGQHSAYADLESGNAVPMEGMTTTTTTTSSTAPDGAEIAPVASTESPAGVGTGAPTPEIEHAAEAKPAAEPENTTWQWRVQKYSSPVVALGVIIAFIVGANMAWSALFGAMLLTLVDAALTRRDPEKNLSLVGWDVLFFFCGLFIVTASFNKTGLPGKAFEAALPYLDLGTFSGVFFFSLLVLVGSNIVSNVPLVLMFAENMSRLPNPTLVFRAWMLLAYVSTVAGNFTLVGSVANLIVSERAAHAYNLGFYEYLRFGVPSTIAAITAGVIVICALT